MFDPEHELEYELKCERIAAGIEMLILDGICAALGKLRHYLQEEDFRPENLPENMEPPF